MVYDGGKHTLLYRNEDLIVILDFINAGVRSLLHRAREALIVELRDGSPVREYTVLVSRVQRLPAADEKLPQ